MKLSIGLPVDNIALGDEFVGQEAISDMARAAEAAGFDACSVTDHPVPTTRWLNAGGHYAQDPFVALSFVAAATKRIGLHTGILVLPYRNPFITARSVATLDAYSHGRVILGVGAGYLKAEFKALGVDFEKRNEIMDEYILAMKAAWTQDEFTFEGTDFVALGNSILPRPVQDPHPPIWIGGNSKLAIRRAVDLGDGWSPFANQELLARTSRTAMIASFGDLEERLAYLRDYVAKVGRKAPLEIAAGAPVWPTGEWEPAQTLDSIEGLRELGVTWMTTGVSGATRAEWCDNAQRFGEEIITKLAS